MSKIYKRFAFDISMLEILYQGAAGKQKIGSDFDLPIAREVESLVDAWKGIKRKINLVQVSLGINKQKRKNKRYNTT